MQDVGPLLALGFTDTIAERLNRRLGRIPSGCLIWLGASLHFGHGAISIGGRGTGITSTHRVSWMLENGPIPDGMFVCHHCDTPACCEPTHLYLGTAATNTDDMRRRNRFVAHRGEDSTSCRITDEQVRQIRADYTGKWGDYTRLARQYGISKGYVSDIIRGAVRTTA